MGVGAHDRSGCMITYLIHRMIEVFQKGQKIISGYFLLQNDPFCIFLVYFDVLYHIPKELFYFLKIGDFLLSDSEILKNK